MEKEIDFVSMEKPRRYRQDTEFKKSKAAVQNLPPNPKWQSLEHFWQVSVKGGNKLIFESFKAHLKAMGYLNKQEKWAQAAIHFGIPIEDDKAK